MDYANEFWIDSQIKLGRLLKDMPKNEGTKGQLIGRGVIGGNKTVPPIEDTPATYQDLGIAYKDAALPKRKDGEDDPATYTEQGLYNILDACITYLVIKLNLLVLPE